ncbi:MAG: A/G-specific adenine glycosylase [Acidobacteria bacterium]|nr:A/G-specific adenine glycosylase [Acidobacteriota bacterium]
MPSQRAAIVEAWFRKHQRFLPWRAAYLPYHVWVSEVMLQQTRMEVVLGYYEKFLDRFPTIAALAAATDDEVMSAWSGLGYYRRARMLRDGARDVVERFRGKVPATVDELLTIGGIGRYTAGAVASIAHKVKAPIVDGNVARILARLFAIEAPLKSPALMREAWRYAEELVSESRNPRDFNQGLMEIGALICKPSKPRCDECPLTVHCLAFQQQRVDEFPRKAATEETRAMRIALYVVRNDEGLVLMRRERGKLMNAMFHLPHGDTTLLDGAPLPVRDARHVGTFRHTVTNRRIAFEVFTATIAAIADSDVYAWIDTASMSRVPHPSYVKKALALADQKSFASSSAGLFRS